MDKVKITQEQADLLDELLTTKNVALILQLMSDWKNVLRSTNEMSKLHEWYITDTLTVSKALIIGYEVEETPEDKIKAQYEAPKHFYDKDNDTLTSTYRKGIKFALDTLNIKIEGVNHD
jgi:p-aminobenzoyl-glutamate transporter AbgT